MSGTDNDPIFVRATSKGNGITTLLIGVVGLVVSALWIAMLPEWLFLAGIFLTSASIVTLLIGYFKLREPPFSMEISPDEIRYHHRRGNWLLHWDNIQRIDCPRIQEGLSHTQLDAVGIRIKDYGAFLAGISPRLATHLLMEQRPLLIHQRGNDCASGDCFSQAQFDDKHYVLENGETYTGVKAMLANRMTQLRELLGYDIYISGTDIDREPSAFVALLRQCQTARQARNMDSL